MYFLIRVCYKRLAWYIHVLFRKFGIFALLAYSFIMNFYTGYSFNSCFSPPMFKLNPIEKLVHYRYKNFLVVYCSIIQHAVTK